MAFAFSTWKSLPRDFFTCIKPNQMFASSDKDHHSY